MKILTHIICIILFLGLLSASCDRNTPRQLPKNYTEDELFDAHKRKVGEETRFIDAFVIRKGWNMEKTSTGIRYEIYAKGDGDSAEYDMIATVAYQAFLLDSTLVDRTDPEEVRQYRIGHDDLVTGLHEALTLMHVGDSARFVIPSYLAFGLTGNQSNIPPNSALYYEITLLGLD